MHIDSNGGRLVTVMPRSRKEDAWFRERVQTENIPWEPVWDRPNPRRQYGPRDRWYVYTSDLPSMEGWPVVWVYSTLLALNQKQSRIEALFFLYCIALLIQALIERELRRVMKREQIDSLPLYPEERACPRPTVLQILRIFRSPERHALLKNGETVQKFPPQLTDLQRQIMGLLGISPNHSPGGNHRRHDPRHDPRRQGSGRGS